MLIEGLHALQAGFVKVAFALERFVLSFCIVLVDRLLGFLAKFGFICSS